MEINNENSSSDVTEADEPNEKVIYVPLLTLLDKNIKHHIVNKA